MSFTELLQYNAQTGALTWKTRTGGKHEVSKFNRVNAGQEAGSRAFGKNGSPRGIVLRIMQKDLYAHRVIWEMVNGPIPQGMVIDHIDRNPFNNSLSNLRLATRGQNNYNACKKNGTLRRNTCGLKGVYMDKQRGLWCAEIRSNKKRIHLGRHQTRGLAAVAYAKAALRHHGAFSLFASRN